jgi:2-oxoisovalerate dehydrogenase E1 component
MTFRMRGHEEASGVKYVPKEMFEKWEPRDPLKNYEQFLIDQKIITADTIDALRKQITQEIDDGLKKAFAENAVEAETKIEKTDLFLPFSHQPSIAATENKTEMRLVDAISNGLKQAMQKFDNLVIMGQDVADYGGVFKITEGFMDEFGKERVRNTPICESAIVGASLGLSIKGYKSVVEMQFADFVTCGFNQIVHNLAKSHYRWGQNADVVVRMPTGAGVGAGPFHSQSNEAWFTHTPGLKVVYPSTPSDAKGLLISAIEDPNPVLYFEHKALYRKIKEQVHTDYYNVKIGKARLAKTGDDVSIITYGMGVHWALQALEENRDIDADIIDLRTLLPLDYDSICRSVKKNRQGDHSS